MDYKTISNNFLKGLWNKQMLYKAVEKKIITKEQYQELIYIKNNKTENN